MSRCRTRQLATLALALAVPACGGGASRAASTPASTPGASPAPAPAGFTLVFSDEFDAPGALDATRWAYEIGYVRNDEKQYYTSRLENVRAEGGMLVIEGRKESYQGYGYTSASVNTLGRFALRYGRVEVRAKLPSGRGSWPAIWMLGTNIARAGWPACGEIDIMENVGFDPLRVHASVHTAAYNHTIGTQKTASTLVTDPAADFHVYAMEWYPDRIEAFLDGARYFSFRNEGTGSRSWPFDEPQYLLINLALGGAWGGQQGLDDSRFPHRYLVDYVRIYQQQ
jgi:beta-glucanase (GH16 family)